MDYGNQLREWGMEALQLCGEKRPHYILNKYVEFINFSRNCDMLLQELSDVRKHYTLLSNEEGPYHVENELCQISLIEQEIMDIIKSVKII